MTNWKWVRVHGPVHDRLTVLKGEMESARAEFRLARTSVNYDEIIELALNALERERDHGVDADRAGGPGGVAADTGDGDTGRVGRP